MDHSIHWWWINEHEFHGRLDTTSAHRAASRSSLKVWPCLERLLEWCSLCWWSIFSTVSLATQLASSCCLLLWGFSAIRDLTKEKGLNLLHRPGSQVETLCQLVYMPAGLGHIYLQRTVRSWLTLETCEVLYTVEMDGNPRPPKCFGRNRRLGSADLHSPYHFLRSLVTYRSRANKLNLNRGRVLQLGATCVTLCCWSCCNGAWARGQDCPRWPITWKWRSNQGVSRWWTRYVTEPPRLPLSSEVWIFGEALGVIPHTLWWWFTTHNLFTTVFWLQIDSWVRIYCISLLLVANVVGISAIETSTKVESVMDSRSSSYDSCVSLLIPWWSWTHTICRVIVGSLVISGSSSIAATSAAL